MTRLLFSTDISANLVQEKIIVPHDHEQLLILDTDIAKSTFVVIKISAHLQVGYTKSFYKVLTIMENHGNEAAQSLSATIQQELAELRYEGLFLLH